MGEVHGLTEGVDHMRAVIKQQPGYGIHVGEVADPAPGDGEALIAVNTAGICGSDLHAYEWIPEYAWLEPLLPAVLGHELTGHLVGAAGTLADGQRVAIRPATTCGGCEACIRGDTQRCPDRSRIGYERQGGLAARITAPVANLHALPKTVDRDTASLMEPLAVVVHALDEVSVRPGCTAAVVGAGAIGLLAVQALRACGAGEVLLIGTSDDRAGGGLAVGELFGARSLVAGIGDLDAVGRSCQLTLVAAGAKAAMDTAFRLSAPGARIVAVGLGIGDLLVDVDALVRREVQLIGSFGHVAHDWLDALALMSSGQVVGDGIIWLS